jgi:hypothetical protein
MKRLIWSFLLVNLLWVVGLAESDYIVTDMKGLPEVKGPSDSHSRNLRLLGKLNNVTVMVDADEKVTLTSLADGSRITLIGPLTGQLSSSGFTKLAGAGTVKRKAGREDTTSQLRAVSSTMGAVAHRDAKPFLVSRGRLLRRELVWLPTSDFPDCQVILSSGGEVVKEWPRVVATSNSLGPQSVDLSDLDLVAEEPYFLTFVPLKRDGMTNPDWIVRTDVTFVTDDFAKKALEEEAGARGLYQDDPTDLTPLTVYLAYLVNHKLLSDAYLLVLEDSFKEQGANRNILRTELNEKQYQK